jgi:predicted dithiol-disulfide oxidoreductase (DUF899 family)
MTAHKTGTREDWLAARLELLEAEKALTRRSDELALCTSFPPGHHEYCRDGCVDRSDFRGEDVAK